MKACTLCGETKDLSEFYMIKKRGVPQSRCKECVKKKATEYLKTGKGKETAAKWRERNPNYGRDYYEKNGTPASRPSRNAVKIFIRRRTKKLVAKKGETSAPCCICGSPGSEQHHTDYFDPSHFIYLCRDHHGMIHGLGVITPTATTEQRLNYMKGLTH